MRHTTLLTLCWFVGTACAQPVEVWAVPAEAKVRSADPVQKTNLVWDQATKTISLAGARNEHVPFQVMVSAPPTADGFFVTVSDLVSPGGKIPRERVKLYFEHAILCYGASSSVGGTGFWPDALAPLTDPFGMAAVFKEGVRQRGVWADIVTPANIPGGDYSGTIQVTRHGQPVDELKLKLHVYDFALPEATHLITHMGISRGQVAGAYGLPPTSPKTRELLRTYHSFLYANRMEPWFNENLQPEIKVGNDQVQVAFNERDYDLYMKQWKTKRVIMEAVPPELSASPDQVRSYLKQVADYYKAHGWLDRLVFNSPIDEPATVQDYEETRRWAALVHEAVPGVPFLATKSPVSDNPAQGTLSGYVNNFSVHGNALNELKVKEAIRQEQARGGEITWYISCDQLYPQPNYFIDAPAMDPVMVPWITWRYGMQGVLYWELCYWSQTADPWLNPVTYLSGFVCSGGHVLNGEGSLLYPGNRTRLHTGQRDVEGPVSSIRFELLREGIEDYEYLWMLKSLGDAEFADQAARNMVVDVSTFSRNSEQLFALRAQMARRLEKLARH